MSHAFLLLRLLLLPDATLKARGWPTLAACASSAVARASAACPQNIVLFITSYLHLTDYAGTAILGPNHAEAHPPPGTLPLSSCHRHKTQNTVTNPDDKQAQES